MFSKITYQTAKINSLKKLGLSLFLSTAFICSFSHKSLASNFKYSSQEFEIFNTELNTDGGWLLEGTEIVNGELQGKEKSQWGKASYAISPLNLDDGDIFLYWSAILPDNAKTERDKYYVGLQYSDNKPVPYLGNFVDENAELKMAIRPQDKSNSGNSYNQVYIDPDFDPSNNYSPATTRVETPATLSSQTTDYRLQITKVDATAYDYEASFFYWNGSDWQLSNPKDGYTSSLKISSSDWINAEREIESPVTFEAINLLFRNPGSAVTAIALTQIQENDSASVPEPSTIMGLPLIFLLQRKLKQNRKSQ